MNFSSVIIDADNNPSQYGASKNKNFIKVDDVFLIDMVIDTYCNLEKKATIVLNNKDLRTAEHLDSYVDKVIINEMPQGALPSAALGVGKLHESKIPIIICPTNALVPRKSFLEFINFMIETNASAGTITFSSDDPNYSFIRVDKSGNIFEIAEKKVISNFATAGIFYYKTKKEFIDSCGWSLVNNVTTNAKFYIAPSLNYFVTRKKILKNFSIKSSEYSRFSVIN
jgi:bifunctional N-acetylglucosamine-1-phosphate-uridyltransferase/glucosamine-1-phosphate-acetyltransferase GlmU-like protein